MTIKLDIRELSTILAALRAWQTMLSHQADESLTEIATDGETHQALTSDEIDSLCERINQ